MQDHGTPHADRLLPRRGMPSVDEPGRDLSPAGSLPVRLGAHAPRPEQRRLGLVDGRGDARELWRAVGRRLHRVEEARVSEPVLQGDVAQQVALLQDVSDVGGLPTIHSVVVGHQVTHELLPHQTALVGAQPVAPVLEQARTADLVEQLADGSAFDDGGLFIVVHNQRHVINVVESPTQGALHHLPHGRQPPRDASAGPKQKGGHTAHGELEGSADEARLQHRGLAQGLVAARQHGHVDGDHQGEAEHGPEHEQLEAELVADGAAAATLRLRHDLKLPRRARQRVFRGVRELAGHGVLRRSQAAGEPPLRVARRQIVHGHLVAPRARVRRHSRGRAGRALGVRSGGVERPPTLPLVHDRRAARLAAVVEGGEVVGQALVPVVLPLDAERDAEQNGHQHDGRQHVGADLRLAVQVPAGDQTVLVHRPHQRPHGGVQR
mmetsp:Transcript_8671/g.27302  ORF Transcript_8671/g.27302 Transcript_8671/m.27302 type:complete len:436 (-) Transcript_8671:1543-2850(-)